MTVDGLVGWNGLRSLAMCPNAALRRREMSSEIDGSPVIDVTYSFRINWCHWI